MTCRTLGARSHFGVVIWETTIFRIALAAAAAATMVPAAAQEVMLRMHHFAQPHAAAHAALAAPWAAKLEKDSGGRLRIAVHPALELGGGPAQLVDDVKDGVVDIVLSRAGFTPRRFPKTEVFELPFLGGGAMALTWALQDYAERHLQEEYRDYHVLLLFAQQGAAVHATRAIRRLEDFKGLKVRTAGAGGGVFLRGVGAIPVGAPSSTLYAMLSKGLLDGCLAPFASVAEMRLEKLVRHHLTLETGAGNSVHSLLMNRTAYAALPSELRDLLDAHSRRHLAWYAGKTWSEAEAPGIEARQQRPVRARRGRGRARAFRGARGARTPPRRAVPPRRLRRRRAVPGSTGARRPAQAVKPNLIVILIDDLRFDETGASGHPYMKTPHIDRLAAEGASFTNAFHTTPLCSPNRASILTGQYASRHGIIDNVGRDAMSHRLANYHLELKRLGYETAHVGKWHMGNDASPRPGYDHWISFKGQGLITDPVLWEEGSERRVPGYVTDLLNERAVEFVSRKRRHPFALFFAHKAVHPDVQQKQDGTIDLATMQGYVLPERHRDLYRGCTYPPRPNVLPVAEVVKQKPAWKELFELRADPASRAFLEALHTGSQDEIRERAAMMASVDEGVGALLEALEKSGKLDKTLILFLGDNGFFFGEHGLGAERRFPYEEGIRTAFFIRYPKLLKPGTRIEPMVLALDIAPTRVQLAGGRPGAQIQGRSLVPLMKGAARKWRESFLVEYFNESAWPWIVGMSYKAVRTEKAKLIHWTHRDGVDELYDLERDPYEITNVIGEAAYAPKRQALQKELRKLVADSVGL